jgi:2-polyprenyl-3-methyl-5-hydroxy-6-metoxy-1,4-benzoquinol methylase
MTLEARPNPAVRPDPRASASSAAVPGPLAVQRVINAYHDPVVRAYSWGRFKIFRQRFLDEIGQYLPERGSVLDIGCGFGLFALYFAQTHPDLAIHGYDLNPRRVEMARRAAEEIGVHNAHFHVQNAVDHKAGGTSESQRSEPGTDRRFDAVYMLDVVHHVPPETVENLLREVRDSLNPGGLLLVKELDTKPAWQRIFSHVLDLAMTPSAPPHYWSMDAMTGLLRGLGFEVKRHAMVDILPYPHVLYVARRR